ncbi:MAG: hypothetical protein A2Y60_07550 [Chloroflexi bacterium RBG_13_54_9]|nr:MAG: hypothetical protein A2Y60_07550 [Chloroflexi bacterium RBG_13_54_9]
MKEQPLALRHRFRFILSLLVGMALLMGVSEFVNLAPALEKFDEYPWSWLWIVLALSLGYYQLKALRRPWAEPYLPKSE